MSANCMDTWAQISIALTRNCIDLNKKGQKINSLKDCKDYCVAHVSVLTLINRPVSPVIQKIHQDVECFTLEKSKR